MEEKVTVRTFTLSTKKRKSIQIDKNRQNIILSIITQCFFIDRALPTVDLQVSEGERAPSQGAPSGGSSANKSWRQTLKIGYQRVIYSLY